MNEPLTEQRVRAIVCDELKRRAPDPSLSDDDIERIWAAANRLSINSDDLQQAVTEVRAAYLDLLGVRTPPIEPDERATAEQAAEKERRRVLEGAVE